jgi:hypothetical protein
LAAAKKKEKQKSLFRAKPTTTKIEETNQLYFFESNRLILK